jgi:hypothetical protein
MIGLARLSNTQYALQDVVARGIVGDFLEAGVWRGGTCVLARAVFAAYGETSRTVWVADSFAGLPVSVQILSLGSCVCACVCVRACVCLCLCVCLCCVSVCLCVCARAGVCVVSVLMMTPFGSA